MSGRAAVYAVVGPTGVGKSELGIRLAQRVGGEVVNADSMQLYDGMDIGTAKLTAAEREGVAHHLLDVWPVTRTASVAAYQTLARSAVEDLLARGRTPVLVGGSGLYLRAALDDLRFPGTDPRHRADLEAELAAVGPGALHRRLATLDPVAADRIDPANGRRIVRALEVIALTGRPYTAALPAHRSVYDVSWVGLDRPTDELDVALAERVQRMFAAGLIAEVEGLVGLGLRDGVTASRALGYAQVLHLLDGHGDEAAAMESTTRATRRFVRRQRSWFRTDPRIGWHRPEPGAAAALARTIAG